MNNTLQEFAIKNIKIGLSKCTPEEQYLFKRMYSHDDLDKEIYDVVDKISKEKLDFALTQIENTLKKKEVIEEPNIDDFEEEADYVGAKLKYEEEQPWYKLGQLLKEMGFCTIDGEDDYPEQSELSINHKNSIYMVSTEMSNMNIIQLDWVGEYGNNRVKETIQYPLRALTEIKNKIVEWQTKIKG